MNNKLIGTIFILFGVGHFGDSLHDLYYNSIGLDYKSAKTVIFLILGILSCIYGYKQFFSKNTKEVNRDA